MECIQFQSTFLIPFHSKPKQYQKLNTPRLLCPSSSQEHNILLTRRQRLPTMRTRSSSISMSMASSMILGDALPAKGGDIAVLLPTGALLLFMYVIANFVFPYFLEYQFDKANDEDPLPSMSDQSSSDDDGDEEEANTFTSSIPKSELQKKDSREKSLKSITTQ